MPTTDIFQDPFKENPNGLIASQVAKPEQETVASQPPPTTSTTPSNQDWAKGELSVTDEGAYFTPPAAKSSTGAGLEGTAQDNKESVEGRLSGLLSSESPYLTAARTRAKQESNARGLLNSTMAGTAGEKAAIELALPIAQQDASFSQNMALQKNQGEIQKGLYETQGDISSRLSAQAHTQDMAKQDADIAWKQIDLQARMDVEFERMSEENKAMFNETVGAISSEYINDYMEIMVNPNIAGAAARQAALNLLAENTKQRYRLAGEVAGITLEWEVPTGQAYTGSGDPYVPKKTK